MVFVADLVFGFVFVLVDLVLLDTNLPWASLLLAAVFGLAEALGFAVDFDLPLMDDTLVKVYPPSDSHDGKPYSRGTVDSQSSTVWRSDS